MLLTMFFSKIIAKRFEKICRVRNYTYLCNPETPIGITKCGNSSVGRAQPCQGWGREFKSRFPLSEQKSRSKFERLFCSCRHHRHTPCALKKGRGNVAFFWLRFHALSKMIATPASGRARSSELSHRRRHRPRLQNPCARYRQELPWQAGSQAHAA